MRVKRRDVCIRETFRNKRGKGERLGNGERERKKEKKSLRFAKCLKRLKTLSKKGVTELMWSGFIRVREKMTKCQRQISSTEIWVSIANNYWFITGVFVHRVWRHPPAPIPSQERHKAFSWASLLYLSRIWGSVIQPWMAWKFSQLKWIVFCTLSLSSPPDSWSWHAHAQPDQQSAPANGHSRDVYL